MQPRRSRHANSIAYHFVISEGVVVVDGLCVFIVYGFLDGFLDIRMANVLILKQFSHILVNDMPWHY